MEKKTVTKKSNLKTVFVDAIANIEKGDFFTDKTGKYKVMEVKKPIGGKKELTLSPNANI